MHHLLSASAAVSLCLLPLSAFAATVTPVSYGYVVAPNSLLSAYLDDTYDGTTGELTDGISATVDWVGTDGGGLPGPNVGWFEVNPQITFQFDQVYDFSSLVMNIQDGQGFAGVGLAESITVNGVTSPALSGGVIATPLNMLMDLSALAPTDTLNVTVNRAFEWTFLSEFTFEAETATVPLPASLLLLLTGLGGLGLARRRKG